MTKAIETKATAFWWSDAVWQPVLALSFWVIIDGSKT